MSLKKLGQYDLIRVLGKGTMGLAHERRGSNLDRRVDIKTIKVENLSDEGAAEYKVRFRAEARSAACLQHPDIVSVHDSHRDVDVACLVMEFVQGEDLKHHLDARHTYTPAQTLRIMADLLSALGYAHQQNVVHRDIKPADLLVIAGGHIKLADFGVARTQDPGDATRTRGTIVGTLKYMSPEQLEGNPIDARTDLFAAGVVPCCQPNPCGPCLQLQKLQELQIRWSPNHLKPVKNNPPGKNRLHFLKLQQLFRRPKPLPWRLPTAPTQLVKGVFYWPSKLSERAVRHSSICPAPPMH